MARLQFANQELNNKVMIDKETLKETRPDLVEEYSAMDKKQLLNQVYLEAVDAINMEERVQIFMNKCTNNMSDTTYTSQAIHDLINEKQEIDIDVFCSDLLEMSVSEMLEEIKRRTTA